MQKNQDLWYRIGYALETARNRLPASREESRTAPKPLDDASGKLVNALFTVGAGSVLTRVLSLWPGSRRPGLLGLLRAGAAGAAAAFLTEVLRPVLLGEEPPTGLEDELTDLLLSGAGRGLLYAAIVEPRIPAPPLLQGAAYGALEYALTPWGGLEGLAGKAAPQKKVPFLAILLRAREEEDPFLAHLAFGIALALLYED